MGKNESSRLKRLQRIDYITGGEGYGWGICGKEGKAGIEGLHRGAYKTKGLDVNNSKVKWTVGIPTYLSLLSRCIL